MHGPAEVRDLQLAVQSQEQVLGLDVTMNNMLLVAVAESSSHLEDVSRRFLFAEPTLRREALVELAAGGVLEDQIDALLVPEVAVHACAIDRLPRRRRDESRRPATPSPRRVAHSLTPSP